MWQRSNFPFGHRVVACQLGEISLAPEKETEKRRERETKREKETETGKDRQRQMWNVVHQVPDNS